MSADNSVRFHDVIKNFSGDGSEEVMVWLRKFQLVAELRNIKNLETIIPLFLEKSAFAVYEQMSSADKKDPARIEAALLAAFAVSPFRAFDELRTRIWRDGESADVYLTELKSFHHHS